MTESPCSGNTWCHRSTGISSCTGNAPTWADALAGVDPALLTPIQDVPDQWPYRPALWRIELRQHLMIELRRTRWIAYTPTPRSLQPGDQGRGWLRTHPAGTVSSTTT